MKQLLKKLEQQYYLDLGQYALSPISKITGGLVLDSIPESKKKDRGNLFVICIPSKEDFCIWVSSIVLLNRFFQDYFSQGKNRLAELGIRGGDLIEIFGAVARYGGQFEEEIKLEFRNRLTVFTDRKNAQFINKTKKKRINKKHLYSEKKAAAQQNRGAFSSIFEIDDHVNPGLFHSRILLVTGRGNMGNIKRRLLSVKIYGESLSELLRLEKNLRLSPDLDPFIGFESADTDYEERINRFWTYIRQISEGGELENYLDESENNSLQEWISGAGLDSEEFREFFEDISDRIDDNSDFSKKWDNLKNKHYPGPRKKADVSFDCIVLNDISLINKYPTTISALLNEGISIVAIGDRFIYDRDFLGFYADLFEKWPEAIRWNWNKKKILSAPVSDGPFVDKVFWAKCQRFARQQIRINTFPCPELDQTISNLRKLMKDPLMERFDLLRDNFWKHLYPAYFILKNSIGEVPDIRKNIARFSDSLEMLQHQIPDSLRESILAELQRLLNFSFNPKELPDTGRVFCQTVSIENEDFIFPDVSGEKRSFEINDRVNHLVFAGYPINEIRSKHLLKAVSDSFIPVIDIQAWETEGTGLKRYLTDRIRTSYFTDKPGESWDLPEGTALLGMDEIEREISNSFSISRSTHEVNPEAEGDLSGLEDLDKMISDYKYSPYTSSAGSENAGYFVRSDVIHFTDGCFMFLPHSSKIPVLMEGESDKAKIKSLPFSHLDSGLRVFSYRLDRGSLREYTRGKDQLSDVFQDLDLWRESLANLVKKGDGSISGLADLLNHHKIQEGLSGNPSRINLLRWLNDTDMLAPEYDNLRVIFSANRDKDPDLLINRIQAARKHIMKVNSKISYEIKNRLLANWRGTDAQISPEFSIQIGDFHVDVATKKISGCESHNLEIEYSKTRRFLN